MSTPAPRYVCPRCRAAYDSPSRYCGQCGADMQRASALENAARREASDSGASDSGDTSWEGSQDRRVTSANQAWLGKVVDGRYRVSEVVGRGGMGVVYKVEHLRMGKIAAMKVLHTELAGDPEVVRRFEQEALAVSRLDHPNTVQVFDFGAAQGQLYLIMEYVRGQDLGRIIDRDGPLPWARAAPLFVQICGALAEAHSLGIVHRDLKPENVLVTRTTGGRDFAKVLDFGLAKIGGRDQPPAQATDRTEIVGTPYFMSPEQIRGDDVDARSDLYSLGALMYKVLTGDPPFTAKTAVGVLTKHLTAELPAPSTRLPMIDERVDEIVLRALAKDPDQRFASAQAMGEAIDAAYAELVGDATPLPSRRGRRPRTEPDEPLSELRLRRADIDAYERSLRRQRFVTAAAAVIAVVGGAGLAAWWFLIRQPPPAQHEREPNDQVADATRIAADDEVTGLLGKRIGPGDPDRDFYWVALPAGTALVTVQVTAPPNIDVTLTLRDAAGRVLAIADEAALGGTEAIRRRRADGNVTIEVGQRMALGQRLPTENVSDPYTLRVVPYAADAAWENEPNSNPSDASPVVAGVATRGWLDAREDVDLLRWDGATGTVAIEVTGDADLRWRGPDGVERGPGQLATALRTGDLLRLARGDRERAHDEPLPGADAPWTVTIAPAR
jgi:eukaryotic-like serine/threonine-protein kinase